MTAAKRPKNSALEVDLDFEHNVRPAPVITEEVTADIEELIKKRILEVIIHGRFDYDLVCLQYMQITIKRFSQMLLLLTLWNIEVNFCGS